MKVMENLPNLSLLCYLMIKGCGFDATNKTGVKAMDVLVGKGSPENIAEILNRFVSHFQNKEPSSMMVCMGSNGCGQMPVLHISCPHEPFLKVCGNCFVLSYTKHKCGCEDEIISPIPRAEDVIDKKESKEMVQDEFKWITDILKNGHGNGFVEDSLGNKFTWCGAQKFGREIRFDYRCSFVNEDPFEKKMCKAIVRRTVDEVNGSCRFLLEGIHNHPLVKKRKADADKQNSGKNHHLNLDQ